MPQRFNEQSDLLFNAHFLSLNRNLNGQSNQAQPTCLLEGVQRQFELTYGHNIQLHQKLAAGQIP